MNDQIEQLRHEIATHESNAEHAKNGFLPLFVASGEAKIVIIGQAPGIKAQTSGIAWDDASGVKLMSWLGVSQAQFRDASLFSHIPMDFYYPGKGKSGDSAPRKDFAAMWHDRLFQLMPKVELTVLIGQYAQKCYLQNTRKRTLTETVREYQEYLPEYFPLVHPSPLNFRWFAKNPWFEQETISILQKKIAAIISS